jgi:predicted MFS family arabinose efflux permease
MQPIWILAIGGFAFGLDAYVMAGLLPAISADFHIALPVSGQLVTAFTLSYAIAAPILAAALAGTRVKSLLICALWVFVLTNLLTPVSPTSLVAFLSRALAGLGAGLYAALAAAAAAGFTSAQKRGRGLSMVDNGMSAGTVLACPSAHTSPGMLDGERRW